jgi:hypothetical protein
MEQFLVLIRFGLAFEPSVFEPTLTGMVDFLFAFKVLA